MADNTQAHPSQGDKCNVSVCDMQRNSDILKQVKNQYKVLRQASNWVSTIYFPYLAALLDAHKSIF